MKILFILFALSFSAHASMDGPLCDIPSSCGPGSSTFHILEESMDSGTESNWRSSDFESRHWNGWKLKQMIRGFKSVDQNSIICLYSYANCYKRDMQNYWTRRALRSCQGKSSDAADKIVKSRHLSFDGLVAEVFDRPMEKSSCDHNDKCCWEQKNLGWIYAFDMSMKSKLRYFARKCKNNFVPNSRVTNGTQNTFIHIIDLIDDMSTILSQDEPLKSRQIQQQTPGGGRGYIMPPTELVSDDGGSPLLNSCEIANFDELISNAKSTSSIDEKYLEINRAIVDKKDHLIRLNSFTSDYGPKTIEKATESIALCKSQLEEYNIKFFKLMVDEGTHSNHSARVFFSTVLSNFQDLGVNLNDFASKTAKALVPSMEKLFKKCDATNARAIRLVADTVPGWRSGYYGMYRSLESQIFEYHGRKYAGDGRIGTNEIDCIKTGDSLGLDHSDLPSVNVTNDGNCHFTCYRYKGNVLGRYDKTSSCSMMTRYQIDENKMCRDRYMRIVEPPR